MPKVSVIVPVYGVEKYIERCARSLFEQTLDDIEYLFIDDCTPDRSVEILKQVLEEYPQRISQVTIHRMEQNSGQAAVRKWGMQNVTGEYVIHCDSDDWVDINMYKHMYEKAVEDNAGVVVCDYVESDGKNNIKRFKGCNGTNVYDLIDDILFQKIHGSLWNKLFSRACYKNDFMFPEGNLWEDMAIVIQMLSSSSGVSYIPIPFYFYYTNPESIVHSKSKEKYKTNFLSQKKNIEVILDALDRKKLSDRYKNNIINLKFRSLQTLYPYVNDKGFHNLLISSYPKMIGVFILSHDISLRNKISYLMALLRIYPFFSNHINRFIYRTWFFKQVLD